MRTEVFTTCLDASGTEIMRPIERKVLPVGSRVFGKLGFGGSESGTFYVYSEPDERGSQLLVEEGGWHRFKNWDRYCDKPISQKFGIGLYWDDIEPDYRKSKDELEKLFAECKAEKERKEKERKEKEEADKKECEELRKKWDGILTPISYSDNYRNTVKANILAYMKHKFGVSFTAKRDGSTYILSWTNGPTEEEVRKESYMFVDSNFNGYTDSMDYTPTNFTRVFGGIEYSVYTNRKEKEIPVRATKQVEPIKANGVEIVDYSEKSFAVIGGTKAIKDTLKQLGGRFNPRLSCGCGWIFSKKSLEDVKKVLAV